MLINECVIDAGQRRRPHREPGVLLDDGRADLHGALLGGGVRRGERDCDHWGWVDLG